MLEFASEAAEAAALIRRIVEPARAGESVKALIRRAGCVSGFGHRRVKAIWYGEARAIRAEELDQLRRAAARKGGDDPSQGPVSTTEFGSRLARIEAYLARADPDFHRESLAALRALFERVARIEALLLAPNADADRPLLGALPQIPDRNSD